MYSFLAPELGWHDLDVQSLLLENDGTAARGARYSDIWIEKTNKMQQLDVYY